jgi:hypothetical protein
MAILIKEAMINMSDLLNTKKEIDEYFKIAIKEIAIKKKEEEKAAKPEKVKKPKKDKAIDSNDDEPKAKPEKVKKPKKDKAIDDSNED